MRCFPSRFVTALALLAIVLVANACARDGRDLAEAQDWQTTTTRPPPPTSALDQEVGQTGAELWSSDFAPGGEAPVDATCGGANQPPSLGWSGVPAQTGELALALIDQTDANAPLLLWLIVGIPAETTGISEGALPVDAVETLNDYGQSGWGNPCFETLNSGRRDLQFRLYLIETPTGIQPGAAGNEAWDVVVASANDSATVLMRLDANP